MVYKPYFKIWIGFLLGLCLLMYSGVYAEPSPIRVIIIGSKHNGNKLLTVNSMCNAINTVWGAQTAEWLGIWKNLIEFRKVRKYQKKNKQVCISPFDVFIPKKHIYLITVLWKKATRRLCPMFTREVLNNTESAEYEKYTEINNAFLQILDSSLVQMNRALLTDTIENILYREKHF